MSYNPKGGHGYGNQKRRSVMSVQASRSKRSQNMDARLHAPLAKSLEQWMNDPSHYDLPNVDAPKSPQTINTPNNQIINGDKNKMVRSIGEIIRHMEGMPMANDSTDDLTQTERDMYVKHIDAMDRNKQGYVDMNSEDPSLSSYTRPKQETYYIPTQKFSTQQEAENDLVAHYGGTDHEYPNRYGRTIVTKQGMHIQINEEPGYKIGDPRTKVVRLQTKTGSNIYQVEFPI